MSVSSPAISRNLRQPLGWKIAFAMLPLLLMAAFAYAAMVLVGLMALLGIAIACVPYMILLVGSLLLVLWTRTWRGLLWMVVPAVLLAGFQAFLLVDHVRAVAALRPPPPGQHPDSISPTQATAIFIAASGVAATLVVLCWTLAVLLVAWYRVYRRAGRNKCSECSYDRAGLLPNAVCPECGHGPEHRRI